MPISSAVLSVLVTSYMSCSHETSMLYALVCVPLKPQIESESGHTELQSQRKTLIFPLTHLYITENTIKVKLNF